MLYCIFSTVRQLLFPVMTQSNKDRQIKKKRLINLQGVQYQPIRTTVTKITISSRNNNTSASLRVNLPSFKKAQLRSNNSNM